MSNETRVEQLVHENGTRCGNMQGQLAYKCRSSHRQTIRCTWHCQLQPGYLCVRRVTSTQGMPNQASIGIPLPRCRFRIDQAASVPGLSISGAARGQLDLQATWKVSKNRRLPLPTFIFIDTRPHIFGRCAQCCLRTLANDKIYCPVEMPLDFHARQGMCVPKHVQTLHEDLGKCCTKRSMLSFCHLMNTRIPSLGLDLLLTEASSVQVALPGRSGRFACHPPWGFREEPLRAWKESRRMMDRGAGLTTTSSSHAVHGETWIPEKQSNVHSDSPGTCPGGLILQLAARKHQHHRRTGEGAAEGWQRELWD
jgi:hypothetical protein